MGFSDSSCPRLSRASAPYDPREKKDVDGRDKPGHDDLDGSWILTGRTVLWWLLAFFGVVIGVNTVMMAFAIGTMPGLETEKPYQAGIGYNAEIAAARVQASRNWKVISHIYRDTNGRAFVKVEARDRNGAPLTRLAVTVRFARPADQRADRIVSLAEHESGDYVGQATDVAPGVWDVELDAERGTERVFRSRNRITLD
jgi:nitrogen fixation protein FixH